MSYVEITKSVIKAGAAFTTTLASSIASNFIDHESRILSLEGTSVRLPAGIIIEMSANSNPAGYLECLGQAISRTLYADLFAAIGVLHGAGDGISTFNLPNDVGRVGVGAGTGASLTARALGDEFGEETHQLTESELAEHAHGITDTGHNHAAIPVGSFGGTPVLYNPLSEVTTFSNAVNATTQPAGISMVVNNSGGDAAHNNVQKTIVLRNFIKT